MIVGDEFRGVTEFGSGQPGVFFVSTFIAKPTYEVEELTSTSLVDL